jgi:surface antigen
MTKIIKNKKIVLKIKSALLIGLVTLNLVAGSPFLNGGATLADKYDEKIKALEADVEAANQKAADAASRGDTLQAKLDELNGQISTMQGQIRVNQAKTDQLGDQINEAEKKITSNKKLLAQSLKQLYVESTVSSLEMLASSSNLSEYIDKQEQLNKTQFKVSSLTREVQNQKVALESQKTQVDNLIQDQRAIKVSLDEKQSETNQLLETTKGEEAAYQSQITSKKQQIDDQREQQAEANKANIAPVSGGVTLSPGTGGGGYPSLWANAPQDSMVDSWGMYNRECVSYTAYRVASSGRHMPYWGGRGDAKKWDDNARAAGIPVDTSPKVGDVAISNAGYYGHAMYVEAVYNNGTVKVSQYNYGIPMGMYSEMVTSTAGLYFIHFP